MRENLLKWVIAKKLNAHWKLQIPTKTVSRWKDNNCSFKQMGQNLLERAFYLLFRKPSKIYKQVQLKASQVTTIKKVNKKRKNRS